MAETIATIVGFIIGLAICANDAIGKLEDKEKNRKRREKTPPTLPPNLY